jgi:GNAT superfamily N-acetyltransferase
MTDDFDTELRNLTDSERGNSEALNWVLNSWLQSNRDNGMSFGHGAQFDVYWTMHERLAKRLARGGEVLLATMPDAPDVFVGWACFDAGALHYLYVKKNFRRGGVATKLLEAIGPRSVITHAPAPQREWARQWLLRRGCVCSPYALIPGLHDAA